MSFLTNLIFQIVYFGITLGNPAYQVYVANKNQKMEKLWICYFFVFGIFTILESTLLWPVKFLLNLTCCCAWKIVKTLFALWLQHPSYRGALFIEQKAGPYIDLAYDKVYTVLGKVLYILGVPDRRKNATEKTVESK